MIRRLAIGLLWIAAPSGLFAADGVWTTTGPSGGALGVVTDPGVPGVVYTENFRSVDGGMTWRSYGLNPPYALYAVASNPNNPEVFVKMLEGTALNGSYWFFYGGLTDLEYTLTVTEAATGKQKTYSKPAGSECGGSDTGAFAP